MTITKRLQEFYHKVMTHQTGLFYYPLFMEEWRYKAAFVVQFRQKTDLEAGRCAGRVEHMASYEARHFHSLEELLEFIATMLTKVRQQQSR